MRRGGQRSRRFERRQKERMAQKQLIAKGREAARKMQRQKYGIELTQEERLAMIYAFRYALKQRMPGMDNVQRAMKPHLSEFKIGTLTHMVTDIDVHWSVAALNPERYSLVQKEQEDFRAMLVQEIERRGRND